MSNARCLAVAVALLATLGVRSAEPTTSAELAEGAAIVATCRLGQDQADEAGRKLLAFALAMDPGNERALLIQARLDRDQALEPAELADGGAQYVERVERAIAKTRSKTRALLYYHVIELVDPKHEKALLELTRAKNQGTDTDFEALLRSARGKESPRRAGADGDAPTRTVFEALDDVTFVSSNIQEQMLILTPMYIVNQLNRQLQPAGLSLQVRSRTRAVESHSRGEGEPAELYSTTFQSRAFRFRGFASGYDEQLQGLTGRQVVLLLCILHDLGWKEEDDALTLVDREDASGAGSGTLIDARELAAQAKKSQVDFLNAYRGKDLLVWGHASGIGKGTQRYVHLANDQIRIYFAPKLPDGEISKLGAAAAAVAKANRDQRSSNYSDVGDLTLLFVATARCDGISSGRITFKNCREFTILKAAQARRD